ncbi:S8 family serine peptidase [Catellatospora chokoriensis]|nr:S8 family serine peptidase [Catellatospora chokoriensis]
MKTARVARTAAALGLCGLAVTVAVGWLLLALLADATGETGLVARTLGGDLATVVATGAAATGAPVHWSLPNMGVEGEFWPAAMLFAGSPLVLLVLAPLAGGLTVGALSAAYARRRGRPAGRVLAAGAAGYALVMALVAVLAPTLGPADRFAVVRTSPLLVLLFAPLWAAAAGRAGAWLHGVLARRTPDGARRLAPVFAAVLTVLATFTVVGSNGPQPAPQPAVAAGPVVEAVPSDPFRRGVQDAVEALRQASGDRFLATQDPWRGVPSMLALASPVRGGVTGWLREHAGVFAVADPTGQLVPTRLDRDGLGQQHQWFDQAVRGVPVYGARVGVHLDATGGTVRGLTNGMQPALTVGDTRPKLASTRAVRTALRAMPGATQAEPAKLYLLPEPPHPDRPTQTTLTWRVVLTDGGEHGTRAYFVDAAGSGRIVKVQQLSESALHRTVWDAANTPNQQDPPARDEGGPPSSIANVNQAYDYAGDWYHYFLQEYGRDSYDGNGARLQMATRYTEVVGQSFNNAYWNGTDGIIFGENMTTRDIVGHEWTHAVTQFTANLLYDGQSGALNESFSDIFGEALEEYVTGQTNWLMGTGSALGTIRDMADPTAYGQPDHLRDFEFGCFDNGGVHTNSGIPNKAFYVLAKRIGIRPAAKIFYRALVIYLAPQSGFTDARNATLQSAWDLYGKQSTQADEVWRAWGSVGVDGVAEVARGSCSCFAEMSLHGDGLGGLSTSGFGLEQVTGALLRARQLLEDADSPALAHFNLVYQQANADALALLGADPVLQRKTAHVMQTLAPLLSTVGTAAGAGSIATKAVIDETVSVIDAYIEADRAHGSGRLADLLEAEFSGIDTAALAGRSANEVKDYFDVYYRDGTPRSGGATPSAAVDEQVNQALARSGRATVMVLMRDRADLSAAAGIAQHAERAGYVFRQLGLTASRSQQPLADYLRGHDARFEQFWLTNAVIVSDADAPLVQALAARSDIARIRESGTVKLQQAQPAPRAAAVGGVEWGVDRIRAPEVWSQFGTRGEGIVVANIDTGVQFDHPALVEHYRGKTATGFQHDYNWFDPSQVCGQFTNGPCDNNDHGTHTMGTMVGGDASNQTGVAPGAKWIAAKGCEGDSCTDSALLRSGQWVIAPTDGAGLNPRPDLAPNIVNNSWGGGSGDPFYADIVNAWVQAGIFPAFANGNSGAACDTASSPGDYPSSFSVGAFDVDNHIAGFSSRGPSRFNDEVKPDISAPGVSVRSTVPSNGYATFSGTSMATPHLAGTVALMWSAAPSLVGDIAETRRLLGATAVDMPDASCAGAGGDNNVWGEGRLDAYSAVAAVPRGPLGTTIGTVTDLAGRPVAGASVTARSGGDTTRTAVTDPAGSFSLPLPIGDYQLTATGFGFQNRTVAVQVQEGVSVRRDMQLTRVPRYRVQGQVKQGTVPAMGGTVSFVGTPLPAAKVDGLGWFGLRDVPAGQYTLRFGGDGCAGATTMAVTVDWDETVTVAAAPRTDSPSYGCASTATAHPATTSVLALTGDDATATVTLPFSFPLYSESYPTAYVSTNGMISFDRPSQLSINGEVPSHDSPNAAVYGFWDDLLVDAQASVRTGTSGSAPDRRFTVEWRDVAFADEPDQRVTFAIELGENGDVVLHYDALAASDRGAGDSATIGVEDASGVRGLRISRDEPVLRAGRSYRISMRGVFTGRVVDGAGAPIADTQVVVSTANEAESVLTGPDGRYRILLAPGAYTARYYRDAFTPVTVPFTVGVTEGFVVRDVTLAPSQYRRVSGFAYDDDGEPVGGATVVLFPYIGPNGYTAVSGADGSYEVPEVIPGDYLLILYGACQNIGYTYLNVGTSGVVKDVSANRTTDSTGRQCFPTTPQTTGATNTVPLTGDDATAAVTLPFAFRHYGVDYTSVYVSTNGLLTFGGPYAGKPYYDSVPDAAAPNAALFAYFDDLVIDASSSVRTGSAGSGADQRFVIEWHDALVAGTSGRVTVQVMLYADGRVRYQYLDVAAADRSGYEIVGIENQSGSVGLRPFATWGDPVTGLAIEFRPPVP